MRKTIPGIVHDGKIELSEDARLPEGARVLVMLLPDDESDFWMAASQRSLGAIWDNPEDDVYAELLQE